jgi:predicted ATPase
MLVRLYIDNFRCFVNFELKPERKQLIVGTNGSGKSSLLDALLLMRQFATKGDTFDDFFVLSQRTRWLNQPHITCELEAALDGGSYVYRLVIEPWGDYSKPRVASETVHFNGKPIFEFVSGEVHLYDDLFEHKVTYDFDWNRSALATIIPRHDNHVLTRFKWWVANLYCFRINPYAMTARAESEQFYPNVDLSNMAAWYRHLVQADPKQNAELLTDLRESIDGFRFLQLDPAGENIRLLAAEFDNSGKPNRFYFHELSDGQRCLICLYTVLQFLLTKGSTVIVDEPENFISLREIQPWLMAVADTVDGGIGQALLISHHPEVINQWAPDSGVQLVRDNNGPVRTARFTEDPDLCLSPSELIARGWQRE